MRGNCSLYGDLLWLDRHPSDHHNRSSCRNGFQTALEDPVEGSLRKAGFLGGDVSVSYYLAINQDDHNLSRPSSLADLNLRCLPK